MDVSVIIISGRAGSGKTSVAFEVCEQLRRHGIPHANIDTDYLDDIWPQEDGPELFLKNLAAIWSTYYHDRGCRRLILSGTSTIIDTSQIQETIKQASQDSAETDEDKIVQVKIGAFILTAEDSVASERLKKREIGSALERHLASSNNGAGCSTTFQLGHIESRLMDRMWRTLQQMFSKVLAGLMLYHADND